MTRTRISALALSLGGLMAVATLAAAAPALAGDVTVTIGGIEPRGGQLLVSLQTEAQFMQAAGFGEVVTSPDGTVQVTFRDVPAGTYALSVLHDQDGDWQMDTSDIGMPLEGWAMINGASLRAAPTFSQVSTPIGAEGASLAVDMIYFNR